MIFSSLAGTEFKFDVGAKLKGPWEGPLGVIVEFEVPLVAITYMSGSYTASEAVYTLTSTANYYHIWDIYEFGSNTGTTAGFVPTFSVYS